MGGRTPAEALLFLCRRNRPGRLSPGIFAPTLRPKAAITPAPLAESITLPNARRTYRGRLRIPPQVHAEVMAMQFWDAYYLAKIQEMKARRKAELEEAGKL